MKERLNKPYFNDELKVIIPLLEQHCGFKTISVNGQEKQCYKILNTDHDGNVLALVIVKHYMLIGLDLYTGRINTDSVIESVTSLDLTIDSPLLDDIKQHVKLFSQNSASLDLKNLLTEIKKVLGN